MTKFIKRHWRKVITVAVGVALVTSLDWTFSNVKSFISGGVMVFYLWTLITPEAE